MEYFYDFIGNLKKHFHIQKSNNFLNNCRLIIKVSPDQYNNVFIIVDIKWGECGFIDRECCIIL